MKREKYTLTLTKSEVNKLFELVSKNPKKDTPKNVRMRLFDLYVMANDIIVNGGGS